MTHDSPTVQGLSASQTRWLVREVEAVLHELGREWSLVDGVAFQLTDGPLMGLDNLARRLQLFPTARWPELVRAQLTTMLSVSLPDSVAPEHLRAKLERPETLGDLDYQPLELLPGLPAVLSAQLPGATVQMGTLDRVEGRDQAYATALDNLTRLPLPRHVRRRADPRVPHSWIEFLEAGDSFGASRVLVLPDVVRRVLRRDFPASGVLVAVPTKFDLWIHVPTDVSVVDTALLLAHDAFAQFSSAPFPLTPHVYLVSPDMQAEALVVPDRAGADVNRSALERLLGQLAPDGPAEAA
jgi:hypothetical protein